MVIIRFQTAAAVWWEQTQATRVLAYRNPVKTWEKLKKLIRARFLPKKFQRVLFTQYQQCTQALKIVEEYTLE